ncbi:hypothetical protein ACHELY_004459, partial [Vibrio vulnificus]
ALRGRLEMLLLLSVFSLNSIFIQMEDIDFSSNCKAAEEILSSYGYSKVRSSADLTLYEGQNSAHKTYLECVDGATSRIEFEIEFVDETLALDNFYSFSEDLASMYGVPVLEYFAHHFIAFRQYCHGDEMISVHITKGRKNVVSVTKNVDGDWLPCKSH